MLNYTWLSIPDYKILCTNSLNQFLKMIERCKSPQRTWRNLKYLNNKATEEIGSEGIMTDAILIISSAKAEFKGKENSAILCIQQKENISKITLSSETMTLDLSLLLNKQEGNHNQGAGHAINQPNCNSNANA